jgi:hypothetical protein
MTATCLRAEQLLQTNDPEVNASELAGLADYFCRATHCRIEEKFRDLRRNADRAGYRLARQVLDGSPNAPAKPASSAGCRQMSSPR